MGRFDSLKYDDLVAAVLSAERCERGRRTARERGRPLSLASSSAAQYILTLFSHATLIQPSYHPQPIH